MGKSPHGVVFLDVDVEKLGQALDRVLEAAVDSALWAPFLEDIAEATGSYGALILPLERRTRNAALSTANMAGALEEYFQAGWVNSDWNIHARPLLLRDGIARTQQYTPPEVLEKHDFYRFLGTHGLRYACLIEWHAVPSELLCLVLHRTIDQAPYTEEEAAILVGMRARLMVAARMAYKISQNRISGTIVGLDIARMATIFFDRLGKITHVNNAATDILGPQLQVIEGELRSIREAETASIRNAVKAMLAHPNSGIAENVQAIPIERKGQRPLLLRIQRLNGEMDLFAHSVGICVIDVPEQQRTAPPQILKQVFGLTEQEASIAVRLCEGHSLREISEATDRSYETVRTHMKSILQKTGTSRQGELIALVAKMKMFEINS